MLRNITVVVIGLILCAGKLSAADFTPTAQASIVPAESKLELLWAAGEFTEGPALAPDGAIVFSDIGTTIYRFDPKTGKVTTFREKSGRANGLMYNAQGELIACEGASSGGGRRISITTASGDVKTLSSGWQGKTFNSPNDLAIAPNGDIYITDPRYGGDEPREIDFEGVFLVKPDGTTTLATRDVTKPNGILITADGKTAFVANNDPRGTKTLLRFTLQKDGSLADKQVLFDFGEGRGIDGMTLDQEGNIYATAGTGDKAGIYVFAPDGKQLAFIALPGDPTNCVFGGGDQARMLYITAATTKKSAQGATLYGLYRIPLAKPGYHLVKRSQ